MKLAAELFLDFRRKIQDVNIEMSNARTRIFPPFFCKIDMQHGMTIEIRWEGFSDIRKKWKLKPREKNCESLKF